MASVLFVACASVSPNCTVSAEPSTVGMSLSPVAVFVGVAYVTVIVAFKVTPDGSDPALFQSFPFGPISV